MGLVSAVAVGSWSLLVETDPEARVAGRVVFILIYATPYLLALLAARSRNPGVRGGLLSAIALLSLAASFSSFSLVTVVFLPATLVLGFSAVESLSASSRPLATAVPAAAVGLLLAAIVGLGFFALFGVQDDEGRCWVSYEGSGEPGARVVGRRCTSDVVTNMEAAMGTGAVVVALLGDAGCRAVPVACGRSDRRARVLPVPSGAPSPRAAGRVRPPRRLDRDHHGLRGDGARVAAGQRRRP